MMSTMIFLGDVVLKIFGLTIITCTIVAVAVAISEVITELISKRGLFKNGTDNVEDVTFSAYRKPVEKG